MTREINQLEESSSAPGYLERPGIDTTSVLNVMQKTYENRPNSVEVFLAAGLKVTDPSERAGAMRLVDTALPRSSHG